MVAGFVDAFFDGCEMTLIFEQIAVVGSSLVVVITIGCVVDCWRAVGGDGVASGCDDNIAVEVVECLEVVFAVDGIGSNFDDVAELFPFPTILSLKEISDAATLFATTHLHKN